MITILAVGGRMVKRLPIAVFLAVCLLTLPAGCGPEQAALRGGMGRPQIAAISPAAATLPASSLPGLSSPPAQTAGQLETAASPSAAPKTIKVATFNVALCGMGRDIDRVAQAIRDSGADIVGIQEVERGAKRSGKVDMPALLAKKSGLGHYVFTKAIDYSGGDYGTVILSRYPIRRSVAEMLDTIRGVEKRAACAVEIETDGGVLTVINTHLSYESEEASTQSLKSLNAFIADQTDGDYLAIGDFNAMPDRVLMQVGGVACANTAYFTHEHGPIDNILYTPGLSIANISMIDMIGQGLSDHNMLIGEVTLP